MASYLITGASRGLGLGLVAQLAKSSKSDVGLIFAAARTKTPELQSLIESSSGSVVHVAMDTTIPAEVDSAVKAVEAQLGDKGLDFLINNAGVGGFAPDWTEKLADLNEEFKINVGGTHTVTTLFLPLLRKGQGKKIMNIASSMGSLALAQPFGIWPLPAYKVSKAGLNALTVQWALALAGEGFVVSSINPGSVKTPLGGGDMADLTLEQGATGILEALAAQGPEKNGKFYMITVPGWENNAGVHKYDGADMAW